MPELKSKHPGLIKAATDNAGVLKRGVGKSSGQLRDISGAATGLKQAADMADRTFKDQAGYCEKVIEKYATKVNEIAEIEEDYKAAKGDKKAEAELEKKHKKADGEADKLRDEYNTAVEVFETISDMVADAIGKMQAASEKFEKFTAGGRAG